jgi:hypothetical protein
MVGTLRNLYNDLVLGSVGEIILGEFGSETANLDPDD